MKFLLSLTILVLPILAKADLICQGYNNVGQDLPVHLHLQFASPPAVLDKDSYGVGVGVIKGNAIITGGSQQQTRYTAQYSFSDPRTRCIAGSTISTKSSGIEINLYSWDPCNHTPVDHIHAAYKGTLSLSQPGGSENIFLTCQVL